MSVNKVILVGNVGKDPDTRYLDENTAVCKFPLATSEVYKNRSGERVEQTEWHNVVLWRGLAQVAEKYVKKGTQLFIEGRIKTRSYEDRDGVKKYITEIVGDNMQMLSRKPQDGDGSSGGNSGGGGYEQDNAASAGDTGVQNDTGTGNSDPSDNVPQQENERGPDNDLASSNDESDDLPF